MYDNEDEEPSVPEDLDAAYSPAANRHFYRTLQEHLIDEGLAEYDVFVVAAPRDRPFFQAAIRVLSSQPDYLVFGVKNRVRDAERRRKKRNR